MLLIQDPGRSGRRLCKEGEFFNSLSPDAMRDLQDIARALDCPAKAVLFQEQQLPTRMLILLDGCAKISLNSSTGRRVILRIAKPTEFLGLSAVLSGKFHEVTAETLHRCRLASIPRQSFLDFLMRHPAVYQGLARELSLEVNRVCEQLRIVSHSSLAAVRLAMLLLEWSVDSRVTNRKNCLTVLLNHEEIGECIGTARETVTRAFDNLKQRKLIAIHGSVVIINRIALEAYADGTHTGAAGRASVPGPSGRRPHVAAIDMRGTEEMNQRVRHTLSSNTAIGRPADGYACDRVQPALR